MGVAREQDLSYQYDGVGNVTSITDNKDSPATLYLSYDEQDRLTGTSGTYTRGYTYQAIGNLDSRTSGTTTSYTYDAGHKHAAKVVKGTGADPEAVSVYAKGNTSDAVLDGQDVVMGQQFMDVDGALRFVRGGAAYASGYDGNGNMLYRCTDGKAQIFGWDHENHLVAITQTTGVTTYAYDGDGQRVKMVSGGVTTYYVGGYYEYTSAGTTRKYYYFAGQRVAEYNGASGYWLLGDHLGSTNVSYKMSDGTTATQRYYVWGAIRSTSGTLPTDYAFTGQRLDASGLLDYNARWYDPALARFVSADSIVPQPGNPQSLNRFSYVYNNPGRYIDPSGNCLPDEYRGSATGSSTSGSLPLSEEQILLAREAARRFGIPFEFLAAVLHTQQQLDYDLIDRAEDVLVRGALLEIRLRVVRIIVNPTQILYPDLRPDLIVTTVSTLDLSLGMGQVRISVAARMEAVFASEGLLPKSTSRLQIMERLETDQGSINYVAAYLRYLADLRTEQQGSHLTDLTTSDIQIIYGAYRAGVDAYGGRQQFPAVQEPGRVGRLLSQAALDLYRR